MEQHTYSLVSILRDDLELGQRFIKKVKEVEQDKKTLLSNADKYNKQFEDEIAEGTKKKQLLIAEGAAKGLTEEQINWGGTFLPTVRTPLLNFLYFILREESTDADERIEQLRNEYHSKHGEFETEGYETNDLDANVLYMLLRESKLSREDIGKVKDTYNKKFGHLQDEYDSDNTELKSPEGMDTMMFEQMGHELFKKLKKLKALSYSPNENESALAHAKFVKLCREYKIDPDKVPCNVKDDFN